MQKLSKTQINLSEDDYWTATNNKAHQKNEFIFSVLLIDERVFGYDLGMPYLVTMRVASIELVAASKKYVNRSMNGAKIVQLIIGSLPIFCASAYHLLY